jgi:hypothetical protein
VEVSFVDDYRNLSCPGVTKAVDEFTNGHDIQPLFLLTGQALLFKSEAVTGTLTSLNRLAASLRAFTGKPDATNGDSEIAEEMSLGTEFPLG